MWRETNLFGVLLPPLLGYVAASLAIVLLVRRLLFRLPWARRIGNPALLQAALFMAILATLIGIL